MTSQARATMRVEVRDGPETRPDVAPLSAAVYPPAVMAVVPWRDVVSAKALRRVLVYDTDSLVAAAGVLFRQGLLEGQKVEIAGIGGVMTLPSHQGRGFGTAAVQAAHALISRESNSSFGVLFCESRNAGFYRRLGWSDFSGTIIAAQPAYSGPYTVMPAMVRAFSTAAPQQGTIDLGGLPW